MRSHTLLPFVVALFAGISLLLLNSIAPKLVMPQLIAFLLAGGVFFFISHFPFEQWSRLSLLGYLGLNFILLATLFIGKVSHGSARWIPIGMFHLQASQLAIPLTGLWLTHYMKEHSLKNIRNLFIAFIIIAIPAFLIVIEPDLGTTIVFVLSMLVIIWLSDVPLKAVGLLAIAGLLAVVMSWEVVLKPYQKQRITSFVSQNEDILGAGYNARQALIAVGSGGVWGRGLGQGIQSHLRFLPERQTDFAFASLAEEVGFAGSGILLSLYALLLAVLWRISSKTEKLAEKQFIFAIFMMFALQTGVNMGMNAGLFPITGVTLPFISYGGSSIIALSICLGFVQSITKQYKRTKVTSLM